jgi:pyruvate/2-oxoglutarate dehydrogenase complex dihydrolipoamide acyltransferase (E2) component
MEYRVKSSGELKTQSELKSENPNTSFPKVWNNSVLEFLGVDPVLYGAKPEAGKYERVERNGVVQDSSDNWIEAWHVVDMFADVKDEDGKVVETKEEQEKTYQAKLDAVEADGARTKRNELLAETDFHALDDSPAMSDEMKTYRQALRDLPSNSDWPYVDFPTKP